MSRDDKQKSNVNSHTSEVGERNLSQLSNASADAGYDTDQMAAATKSLEEKKKEKSPF